MLWRRPTQHSAGLGNAVGPAYATRPAIISDNTHRPDEDYALKIKIEGVCAHEPIRRDDPKEASTFIATSTLNFRPKKKSVSRNFSGCPKPRPWECAVWFSSRIGGRQSMSSLTFFRQYPQSAGPFVVQRRAQQHSRRSQPMHHQILRSAWRQNGFSSDLERAQRCGTQRL